MTAQGLKTLWIQERLTPGQPTYSAAEAAALALQCVKCLCAA